MDTWSGFEAGKTASSPSPGIHHCGKFLEPSDKWAGRGCYCFLMRWHSWAFLADQELCYQKDYTTGNVTVSPGVYFYPFSLLSPSGSIVYLQYYFEMRSHSLSSLLVGYCLPAILLRDEVPFSLLSPSGGIVYSLLVGVLSTCNITSRWGLLLSPLSWWGYCLLAFSLLSPSGGIVYSLLVKVLSTCNITSRWGLLLSLLS